MRRSIGRSTKIAVVVALAGFAVLAGGPVNAVGLTGAPPALPAGQLDASTFQGNMVVATEGGDVVVSVDSGEAALFLDRPDGKLTSLSEDAAAIVEATGIAASDADAGRLSTSEVGILAACGVTLNTLAGPGVYWNSVDGCAVAGYPGYKREYKWDNRSDVLICVQARGWNPGETWYGLGCSYSGGTQSVNWGNSFAYTKVKGMSVSGVTGASYNWRT